MKASPAKLAPRKNCERTLFLRGPQGVEHGLLNRQLDHLIAVNYSLADADVAQLALSINHVEDRLRQRKLKRGAGVDLVGGDLHFDFGFGRPFVMACG